MASTPSPPASAAEETHPFSYWVCVAPTKPAAVALAARLNLEFVRAGTMGPRAGISYPLRRLIATGEDTPANLQILFGPGWARLLPTAHWQGRIEVLYCPPPLSPAHAMGCLLDEGCPVWRPRGPSAEEEAWVLRLAQARRERGLDGGK